MRYSLVYLLRAAVLAWAGLSFSAPASANLVDDFFKAAEMDNVDEVRFLLQRGFNPNVGEKYRGETGLIVALREDSDKVFETLVNAPNINLEAMANNGDTALMMAAYKGNRRAVDILLTKGAKINRNNWTALHYAAIGGKDEVVQTLLNKGADINARSPNKSTPLMVAIYGGHFSTVKLLLDRGANVRMKNELGMNALEFAKSAERQDLIDLLTEPTEKAEVQAAWDALY